MNEIELSESEKLKSEELRLKLLLEKKKEELRLMEKDTDYTKKRDRVLSGQITAQIVECEKEKVTEIEKLQKRRYDIFRSMYNTVADNFLKEDQIIERFEKSEILNSMWAGKKFKGISFKKACEITLKDLDLDKDKIGIIGVKRNQTSNISHVVNTHESPKKKKKEDKRSFVEKTCDLWKNAFKIDRSNDNKIKCEICGVKIKTKKKFKRHMKKCNSKIRKQIKAEKKKLSNNNKRSRNKKKIVRSRYYHENDTSDNFSTDQRGYRGHFGDF
jgi:hypothetical protein